MSRFLIYAIVFIEGFCSLGAEVIALRRLVPHIGSSIVVTAPTIGFFLLALALGYASGAKVAGNYLNIVARNFLIAAALAGIGLAGISVDWMFAHLQPVLVAVSGRQAIQMRPADLLHLRQVFRVDACIG